MDLTSAWNRLGRAIAFSAAICLMVFVGCLLLRSIGKLEYLECKVYDWLTVKQGRGPDLGNAVLVGIDENDIRALDHYPLSDQDKARLIQRLVEFRARVIAWDIYMDLPVKKDRETTQPTTLEGAPTPEEKSGRDMLREQLTKNRNVICAEYWGNADSNEPEIPPPSFVQRGRRVGFVDQPVDHDGSVRRGALYLSYKNVSQTPSAAAGALQDRGAEPSLSLNAANKFLESAGTLKPDVNDLIHIDKFWSKRIPRLHAWEGPYGSDLEDTGYQYLVKYDGPAHFTTYTLQDVMVHMDAAAGQRAFGGKAVIIGMTAKSVKDKINTPLYSSLGSDQWGAEQHVRQVDQLIRIAGGASPLRSLPKTSGILWTFLWTVLAGVFGFRLRYAGHLSIVAVVGLVIIVGTAYSAANHDWLVPVVPPLLCWLVSLAGVTAYMVQVESGDRKTIRELFGKAVQKEVADEMWEHREEMLGNGVLKPREAVATLLFTDLQGFTTLAEPMKPGELISWLNEYLTVMTDTVAANHGIVAKYMGDGMMVAFGLPLSRGERQDARDAVACAMDMRAKMSELRARWGRESRPAPKMRVGIFTGPSVAGSVGRRSARNTRSWATPRTPPRASKASTRS